MHNHYAYIYNELVERAEETVRRREAVLFARSASVGAQQFPVHWGGDCTPTLRVKWPKACAAGCRLACRFGFMSHDIGGFENTAPAR